MWVGKEHFQLYSTCNHLIVPYWIGLVNVSISYKFRRFFKTILHTTSNAMFLVLFSIFIDIFFFPFKLALAVQTENSFGHLSHQICFWARRNPAGCGQPYVTRNWCCIFFFDLQNILMFLYNAGWQVRETAGEDGKSAWAFSWHRFNWVRHSNNPHGENL